MTVNRASRLDRLERAIRPPEEPTHIIRIIIDPATAGDGVLEVLARGAGGSLTHFAREPGESKDALCERVERAMGWRG